LKLKNGLIVLLVFIFCLILLVCVFTDFSSEKTQLYVGQKTRAEALNMKHMLDVPFVSQKPWYCSEASASMVLQYYGYNVSQDYVHDQGYDRFENMLPFISRYVKSHYDSLSLEDLKKEIDKGKPVMIRILIDGYLHTVVVVGYDKNYIYIHDPAVGEYLQTNPTGLIKVWEPTGFRAIVQD